MKLLSFLGNIPQALVLKAVLFGLVFTTGYLVGNNHATERALVRELDNSAKRQAKNHQELIGWYAGKMKELRLAREQQAGADKAAYDNMAKGKATSDANLRTARAALAKALETPSVTISPPIPFNPPSDPGCVMPPSVRVAINDYIASINNHPAVGNSQAPAAGFSPGPDSSDSVLTCADLASSVIDILNHDAMLTAWLLSWQSWSTEALR